MESLPTVGRIVWYQPTEGDPGYGKLPLAALVASADPSNMSVGLAVFDRAGHFYSRPKVRFMSSYRVGMDGYARWPERAPEPDAPTQEVPQPNGVMERVAELERRVTMLVRLVEGRG